MTDRDMSFEFENDRLKIEFSKSNGAIKSIFDKKLDLEAVGESRLAANFKLLVPLAGMRHNYLHGTQQTLSSIDSNNNSCVLKWKSIRGGKGKFDIDLTQTIAFGSEPDEIQITTSIKNRSNHIIEEVWSPIIGGVKGVRDPKKTKFIASLWNGAYPRSDTFLDPFPCNTPYWNEEFDYFEIAYPWELSMQWVELYNLHSNEGLYLASHDSSSQVTFFHFELLPGMIQRDKLNHWPSEDEVGHDSPIGMNCSVAKLPFVKPGEDWESAPVCLKIHEGDWHVSASRYRRWIDSWMSLPRRRPHVSEGMAWQSIVMSWPDDLVSYRFRDIPRLAKEAREYGVNILQLAGWSHGGLDRDYPNYSPNLKLGTSEELFEGIREANRKGVKVLLFVNLQVADINTKQFKESLFNWAAKDRFGKERRLGYGMYTFAEKNSWGFRQLAYMCPSVEPYQNLLIKKFVRLARQGANGLQIDKLCDYGLCYDKSHKHRPSGAFSEGVAKSLLRIRRECTENNSEFLICGEACFDFCWQFIDVAYMRLRDWDHIPVLRYTFPEALITVCVHEFDYHSVNNCLRVGYVINAEIHNLRASLGVAPRLGEYIKEVQRIRNELRDYLWNGKFTDVIGATIDGETDGVLYGVHMNRINENRAVVIMNISESPKKIRVVMSDSSAERYIIYRPFESAFSQSSSEMITIEPARIAVIVGQENTERKLDESLKV